MTVSLRLRRFAENFGRSLLSRGATAPALLGAGKPHFFSRKLKRIGMPDSASAESAEFVKNRLIRLSNPGSEHFFSRSGAQHHSGRAWLAFWYGCRGCFYSVFRASISATAFRVLRRQRPRSGFGIVSSRFLDSSGSEMRSNTNSFPVLMFLQYFRMAPSDVL